MTTLELITIRKDMFTNIEKIMDSKGKEYSGIDDRLANFKKNGEALGLEPETIWRVYAGKHWDSLSSFIRKIQEGKSIKEIEDDLSEPIDGRIIDMITYLFLLAGLVKERRKERRKDKLNNQTEFCNTTLFDDIKDHPKIDLIKKAVENQRKYLLNRKVESKEELPIDIYLSLCAYTLYYSEQFKRQYFKILDTEDDAVCYKTLDSELIKTRFSVYPRPIWPSIKGIYDIKDVADIKDMAKVCVKILDKRISEKLKHVKQTDRLIIGILVLFEPVYDPNEPYLNNVNVVHTFSDSYLILKNFKEEISSEELNKHYK